MRDTNTLALLAMFAVVIVLYALKESHQHYLPDFFGLALAITAPRPGYAVAAVLLLAMIRHSPLAYGFAGLVPNWLLVVVLPAAHYMSIPAAESSALESSYKERISDEETNIETSEIMQPIAENSAESITFAENKVLARLIVAGKIGKTDAIKIGAGIKSGTAYQARTKSLASVVELVERKYPDLTPEKQRK